MATECYKNAKNVKVNFCVTSEQEKLKKFMIMRLQGNAKNVEVLFMTQ
jgi:hypothetical protein